MSIYRDLQKIQQQNNSMICLGLDLDVKRMPSDYAGSLKQMFEFAHRVIDATSDLVCAYKPNLAFYEQHGPEGLSLLKLIRDRIPDHIPVILDGKRNDIGNTAGHYARALFETYRADWVTLNPYMGYDSMRPFLEYKDKGVFVLCLTSNAGSKDFQELIVNGKPLYMEVAEKVNYWNKDQNCGLVVGATHPEQLRDIRRVSGEMPILIPGVGAQGGSLEDAVLYGTDNFQKLAVINVSRSVLYASRDADFAQKARQELEKLNASVAQLRANRPSPGDQQQPAPNPEPQQQPNLVHAVPVNPPQGGPQQEHRPEPDKPQPEHREDHRQQDPSQSQNQQNQSTQQNQQAPSGNHPQGQPRDESQNRQPGPQGNQPQPQSSSPPQGQRDETQSNHGNQHHSDDRDHRSHDQHHNNRN